MRASSHRPRIICHMATSVDGRIVVDGWPDSTAAAVRREYERVHASYDADGWICGRVTMEPFAGGVRSEEEVARDASLRSGQGASDAGREDFLAPGDFDSFAFAIDPSGRLVWETNDIGGDHVVALLSERVSDEYLASLRARGVSYLLAGARDVDLPRAMEKVGTRFGVKTLMLEGGGKINGGMLAAGLVDEVSVLIAPAVDGRIGTPALFDFDREEVAARRLSLEQVERCADDILRLRYRIEAQAD